MKDLCLKGKTLEVLRSFLLSKAGIILPDHQLENVSEYIHDLLTNNIYTSCEDYLNKIQKVPEQSAEFEGLIARVTIGESYFFRDKAQMNFLKSWLPKILAIKKQKNSSLLRIWSAGCSCGQEIYSVAILLQEMLFDQLKDWHLSLFGTDINPNALRTAIDGVYSEWSMRATDSKIINTYFSKIGNRYLLNEKIRSYVSFSYQNLAHNNIATTLNVFSGMDLIICRNVFIYFAPDVIAKTMSFFAKCLLPGGIILLGASDFAPRNIEGLDFIQEGKISYYQKKCTNVSIEVENSRTKKAYVKSVAPLLSKKTSLLDCVEDKVRQADWYSVLLIIKRIEQQKEDVDKKKLLMYKVKALANTGSLRDALDACSAALNIDKLNPELFLLKAFICIDIHDFTQAEAALRGAIFLDKDFIEAYYHLGLLLLRQGQNDKGMKNLQLALNKAEKKLLYATESACASYLESLINALKNEIKTYACK